MAKAQVCSGELQPGRGTRRAHPPTALRASRAGAHRSPLPTLLRTPGDPRTSSLAEATAGLRACVQACVLPPPGRLFSRISMTLPYLVI